MLNDVQAVDSDRSTMVKFADDSSYILMVNLTPQRFAQSNE